MLLIGFLQCVAKVIMRIMITDLPSPIYTSSPLLHSHKLKAFSPHHHTSKNTLAHQLNPNSNVQKSQALIPNSGSTFKLDDDLMLANNPSLARLEEACAVAIAPLVIMTPLSKEGPSKRTITISSTARYSQPPNSHGRGQSMEVARWCPR